MKIILSLLVIPILIFSGSQAFGQLSMGQAPHEIIKAIIDESGTAHVTHIVNNTLTSLKPVQVDMINGNITNLNVTDINGKSVEYGTIQKSPLSIILNASQRNATLIKYDLVNVVTNTDGVWKWNYYEPQDTDFTAFYFPKGVDTIWANNRPVYIGERGLGQHGNGFTLEYIINEPVTIQNVQDAGKSFAVGMRTVSGLGNYVFDRSLNTYSFNVDKSVPVTVIMPQGLLAGPYIVTSNGKPTLHQEFHSNATHAWIGFKPDKNGTIQIAGTTPSQVTIGPQNNGNSATISSPTQPSSDNTITYLVIGGIIAAGIAGLVIVKKSRAKSSTSA